MTHFDYLSSETCPRTTNLTNNKPHQKPTSQRAKLSLAIKTRLTQNI